MDVLKTIKPGQPGSKRLQRRYGDKLLAVRYRLDKANNTRLTTVELVVEESRFFSNRTTAEPSGAGAQGFAAVKVAFSETALRQKIKQAGGYWDAKQRVWWLKNNRVQGLQLSQRVVQGCTCPDIVRCV